MMKRTTSGLGIKHFAKLKKKKKPGKDYYVEG